MTPKDCVLEQIAHRPTDPVPYTLRLEDYSQAMLDAHYGSRQWRDKVVPYIIKEPAFDVWPSKTVDANHFRDVYGTLWQKGPNGIHVIEPGIPSPSLKGYEFPAAKAFFDPAIKAAARKTFEAAPDSFRVVGISQGLLERTWHMRGFENALMDSVTDPEFYEELLDRLTDLFLEFVSEVADLPCEGIMFGDNWGYQNGVILGPERWRKFIKPRWAKVYAAVHKLGKLTLTHCDGRVVDIMDDIVEMGLDVLESVQPEAMDPYDLKKRWGGRITFWGGLGSQSTIHFGPPDEIRREIRRLCKEMGHGGGYIIGPSKPPMPNVPAENIVAMFEAMTEQKS